MRVKWNGRLLSIAVCMLMLALMIMLPACSAASGGGNGDGGASSEGAQNGAAGDNYLIPPSDDELDTISLFDDLERRYFIVDYALVDKFTRASVGIDIYENGKLKSENEMFSVDIDDDSISGRIGGWIVDKSAYMAVSNASSKASSTCDLEMPGDEYTMATWTNISEKTKIESGKKTYLLMYAHAREDKDYFKAYDLDSYTNDVSLIGDDTFCYLAWVRFEP